MSNLKGLIEIEIGGKKRSLKFGTNQTALFCEITGLPLSESFNVKNFKAGELRDFIFSALKDGCRIKSEKVDFTNVDVGDWMDELSQQDYGLIFGTAFNQLPKEEKKTEITNP